MKYLLRLKKFDAYADMFDDVFDVCDQVVGVEHRGKFGDNPHYHFCISVDMKKPALRERLKKFFNLEKGNRHMSLKDWDGSLDGISYLFHEGTDIIYRKGFSDDDIVRGKKRNEEVQSKMVNIKDLIDIWTNDLRQREKKISTFDILTIILNYFIPRKNFIPNKYQLERYIRRIQANLCDNPYQKTKEMLIYDLYYDYGLNEYR